MLLLQKERFWNYFAHQLYCHSRSGDVLPLYESRKQISLHCNGALSWWCVNFIKVHVQWRIQDFPWEGADLMGGANSRGGYVSKNLYVKTKESGPLGGAHQWRLPWIRQWRGCHIGRNWFHSGTMLLENGLRLGMFNVLYSGGLFFWIQDFLSAYFSGMCYLFQGISVIILSLCYHGLKEKILVVSLKCRKSCLNTICI